MQIERRFVRDGKMAQQVHDGIVATAPLAERLGSDHPDVLTALGKLYADTVSNLRPKVMVQGNTHYLGQADIISEIRSEEHTSAIQTLIRISYAIFCLKQNKYISKRKDKYYNTTKNIK